MIENNRIEFRREQINELDMETLNLPLNLLELYFLNCQ